MAEFLPNPPTGPRLYWLIFPADENSIALNWGLQPLAKDNFAAWLATGTNPSHDHLISLGAKWMAYHWLYGRASLGFPIGYDEGGNAGFGSPYNQVNHVRFAAQNGGGNGRSYVDQIVPALDIPQRKGRLYGGIVYSGAVDLSDPENLLLEHGAIPRALGMDQAYDAQSFLDPTNPLNPQTRFVDAQLSEFGIKTIGEAWMRRDVPKLRGWLSREFSQVGSSSAVDLYNAGFDAGRALANPDLYYTPSSLTDLRFRPMLIVPDAGGPTPAQRISVMVQAMTIGCDVWLHGDGFSDQDVLEAIAKAGQFTIPFVCNAGTVSQLDCGCNCDGTVDPIDCCEATLTTQTTTGSVTSGITGTSHTTGTTGTSGTSGTTPITGTTQITGTTPTSKTTGNSTITSHATSPTTASTTASSQTPNTTSPPHTTTTTTTTGNSTVSGVTTQVPNTTGGHTTSTTVIPPEGNTTQNNPPGQQG